MRDSRLIAVHRGGLLDRESHAFLARWAGDCAARVLPLFARVSDDPAPAHALEIAGRWAQGEVRTGVAMKAAVAAHAAARSVQDPVAIAAARAAGHAVATAHSADHSMGALLYALKALALSGGAPEPDLEAQLRKLPSLLLAPISEGVHLRAKHFGVTQAGAGTE